MEAVLVVLGSRGNHSLKTQTDVFLESPQRKAQLIFLSTRWYNDEEK